MNIYLLKEENCQHPLITFVLIAYNAESFVREAIEGALAQTYTPLEIILSDDCSKDGTFAIMEELARGYQGINRIVLNRNKTNLGIGGHINRVMQLAKGEYIVVAAGDDISVPERTERIAQVFRKGNGKIKAAFSDCIEIDSCGKEKGVVSAKPPERFTELSEMCRHMFRGITGATNAWNRSVFDVFGPMCEDVVFEDRVIAFRAALLGDICHIPLPLVRYRKHETNTVGIFHSPSNAAMQRRLECFRDVYLNNIRDLDAFAGRGDVNIVTIRRCRKIILREIRKLNGYLRICSKKPLSVLVGYVQLVVNGGNPVAGIRRCLETFKNG